MGKLIAVVAAGLTPTVLALLALPVLLPPAGMVLAGTSEAVLTGVAHSGAFPIACPGLTLTQGYGPATIAGEPNGFHHGWDLACPAGTPVVSVTAGVARTVTDGVGGGYGNNVQVHGGELWVRYAHLQVVLIADSVVVRPGTVLGLEGSTGFSTGPHLHFEVDGPCANWPCSIDPMRMVELPAEVRRP